MPFTATVEFAEELRGEVVSLATLWRITRLDGEVFCFTDHDSDLNLTAAGITWGDPALSGVFESAVGYTRSAMKHSTDMSVDNVEVNGIINSSGITESDLRTGRFDGALVEIGLVHWRSLGYGVVYLRRGYFGEVQIRDTDYIVELRSLTSLLNREVGSLYTVECQADLGDAQCGVDIEVDSTQDGNVIKATGTVFSVVDSRTFTANMGGTPSVTNYFTEGLLMWTGTPDLTGDFNGGRRVEIDSHTKSGAIHTFVLAFPMLRQITTGDTFTVYAGCNRNIVHCAGKFGPADGRGNIANYRGFNYIPFMNRAAAYSNRVGSGQGSN
jgi:uncharacterized phage protein (TIGR02218 family)